MKRIRTSLEPTGFPISGSGSGSESLFDRFGEEQNFFVTVLCFGRMLKDK
jgi:hypothetical protein